MSGYLADVAAQPAVLRRVLAASRGRLDGPLGAAAALLARHPGRPLLVAAMGSSLSAGSVVAGALGPTGRVVLLDDAGELLHYGLEPASGAGCLLAISQSGRSVETVAVAERLRREVGMPVIAVVNDAASPLAEHADVVLDLGAGIEAAVATRTYVATIALLAALLARVAPGSLEVDDLELAADGLDAQLHETDGRRGAQHLAGCPAIVLIGRGPALAGAAYAALTIKETAALPAEAISGGAFRHGPLELTASRTGFVVLAPRGATTELGSGLAREVAARGCPTWLLTDAAHDHRPDDPPALLVTVVPDLPEPLAPLACAIPLQLAAAELARAAGREAGVPIVATKVTDRE